jgi:hypothetical protein
LTKLDARLDGEAAPERRAASTTRASPSARRNAASFVHKRVILTSR